MRVTVLVGAIARYHPFYRRVDAQPWAPRWAVIHEYCHHLWCEADIEHTSIGGAFLQAVGRPSWDDIAREQFASTLCGTLTGAWRGYPVKKAAWTLEPLLLKG